MGGEIGVKFPRPSPIRRTLGPIILAADLAWLGLAVTRGHSIFGFDARGFDALILPMATILVFGPHVLPSLRGRTWRFILAFEFAGFLVVLASAICGWTAPNTVRMLIRPVSVFWGFWSERHPPDFYLILATTIWVTSFQFLLAFATGWLAENQGKPFSRVPRVRMTMRGIMVAVAIAALVFTGLARWLEFRKANDPWKNAVRLAEEHEARALEHLEAAKRYPETTVDRLRNATYEKAAARSFRAEAKRLAP